MGIDGTCTCAFGTIALTCVTPPYYSQLMGCTTTASFSTGCVQYPASPSPFAYAYNNPSYSGLFISQAVLLTIPVTGNIPIVYIGSHVSPGFTPPDSGPGTIIATPWQNTAPQNPVNTLIYNNHGGTIHHLLPPSFPPNTTFWVWGLCNDWSLTSRDKTSNWVEGCNKQVPSGSTTIGINDKIVCFYDTTSMSANIINSAAETVQKFLSDLGYTNPHYHYKVAGERYLQWPLSLVQSNMYPQDYLHNGYGNAMATGQGNITIAHNDCAVGAGLGGIQEVNPSAGLGGIPTSVGSGPYNDVVCLLFCDEAAGGVYYGVNNTTNNDCAGTSTTSPLGNPPGTLSQPYWGEYGAGSGAASQFWKYGILQGLSEATGGFLESDYKDYLNAYSTLDTNNIRSYIFQEGPAPSADMTIGGMVTVNGVDRKKAMTQHLFRMFGGNDIYGNLVTTMNVIDQSVHTFWNFDRIDRLNNSELNQHLSSSSPGSLDRYTQGFPYYHPYSSTSQGNAVMNTLPAAIGPYVLGHCNLNYWAENIIGVGADWSLRHYNFEGWFPMGSGITVYSNQYEPLDVNDYNDPSVTGVYTDLYGNPLHSLGTGKTKWPNRLYFELWKMVNIGVSNLIYTTEYGCFPGTPCENFCDLEIKVFKDVDTDCVRDNNEPLAAYVDVMVEDPSGTITVYNTGQSGYIYLSNIDIGFYIINGKHIDMRVPCKIYTAEIPLYEKTFNSGTLGCVFGCTDSTANNYNPQATIDDGSCEYEGCTNECAMNYNSQATVDDGSCCPCLDLDYRIEPSVQAYEHTIKITIEFPNNSIQTLGTGPSGVYNWGGMPGLIYQETFDYVPGTGIIGPGGVIGNGTSFKPDLSNLTITEELCNIAEINCWVVRFDITSNNTNLDYDTMSYTNIQMGTFEFSVKSSSAQYVFIPFDEGATYMGNAIGGAPWPTVAQISDPVQWAHYTQNILGPWQSTVSPAQWQHGFFLQSNFLHGSLGWGLNFFNIGIVNGLSWLSNNNYVSQPVYNSSTGLLENKPFLNGEHWAVKSDGFNTANICGDPPCGCTDPTALNYNPAAAHPCLQNAGQYHGVCIYECQKIVIDIYWVAVRVYGDIRVTPSSLSTAGSSWTYQAVYRDDTFPATPGLGYYNGIPLAQLDSGDFASDIQFSILDEQDTVLFTSGTIPHPRAATGGFRMKWGCYDDVGTFMSSGAPAGYTDGANFYSTTNNGIWGGYNSGWATSSTSSGINIAISNAATEWTTLWTSYTCEALMCSEHSCLKFKRVGAYAKGWESMGAIISIFTDDPNTTAGSTPNNLISDYHIPPGWYKLNLSKQGLGTDATSVWATNWENDRVSIFGVNPASPFMPWIWDEDSVFSEQYWSLWGCNVPGGIPINSSQIPGSGNMVPRLGCTNPLSNDFDFFATESNGSCNEFKSYTKFTTLKVTINVGGSDMLNREQTLYNFDSTNSDIGRRPYDSGTRSMTEAQRDAKLTLEKTQQTTNFFEFVLKRNANANEDKLSDGAQTHMEFARVLEKNVRIGRRYTYEMDVPYGENISFDIVDNFGRDLIYKIEQLGNIKMHKNGPKKI